MKEQQIRDLINRLNTANANQLRAKCLDQGSIARWTKLGYNDAIPTERTLFVRVEGEIKTIQDLEDAMRQQYRFGVQGKKELGTYKYITYREAGWLLQPGRQATPFIQGGPAVQYNEATPAVVHACMSAIYLPEGYK